MSNVLYLVHRLPYPPNKGDKVRSFHLLKHLAQSHRVFLGTFVDDPEDEMHIEALRSYCADLHVARLSPSIARIRSLTSLVSGDALSLVYYRNRGLTDWVAQVLGSEKIDAAVIFSSVMAQYVPDMNRIRTLVDFVDVDSAKWTQYAGSHRWPLSWLYRREGQRLLAYERAVAAAGAHSFFVTEAEKALFLSQAPECADRVDAISNGVDTDYFSPERDIPSPYGDNEQSVVFTGAMDYWPNIDAVTWFAKEVLPRLHLRRPDIKFYVVGRSPAPSVSALANETTTVTGTVLDVRPYLRHAAIVVAPLRIARGIQNKVLEAMSMGRPVIASVACAGAVDAVVGRDFLSAESPDDYVEKIVQLLEDRQHAIEIGLAARQRVLECYSWEAHLSQIDRHIQISVP